MTWSPPSAATPYIRQAKPWSLSQDPGEVGTITLDLPVLTGSMLVVWVTDENLNGAPMGSGAPYPVTLSDSQGGGVYSNLGYVTDQYEFDALQAFYRLGLTAGSLTVTCNWVTNQWHGFVVAEIANVGASPTVTGFGTLTVNPSYPSTDTISSGSQALGSSPALLTALSYNATDITTSAGYPAAGSGFATVLTGWNWGGTENTSSNDVANLEWKYLANPGAVAATFSPRSPGPNPENFLTIAVAIQP